MANYDIDNDELSHSFYFWHKSFGMLVLFIMLWRIVVRMRSQLPELPKSLPKRERKAAHFAHWILYVLAIVVPVFGYVMSSSYENSSGVPFFMFDLPELVADNEKIFDLTHELHEISAYILLAVLVVHIAAVIKHRFFDDKKNNVLDRML